MPQGIYVYILSLTRPAMLIDGPTPEEAALRLKHRDYVGSLKESGALVLAGRTVTGDERSTGYVVFRAAGDQAAREVVEADPGVAEGLMTAELFPFDLVFTGKFD